MKSQQQELSIITNCKQCAFAIYDGDTQVSCEFDRINKFGEKAIAAYDEDKKFYIIDTLCSYYRDIGKGYSLSDKEKAVAQSAISFDVIIDCNNISKENRNSIVQLITKNLYHKEKLNIILVHEHENKQLVQDHVSYVAKVCDKFAINISVCRDMKLFLHDHILKSKKMCHMIINNYSISLQVFHNIDNFVNDKLGKFLVIDNSGTLCISNVAYRMCSSINNQSDYNKNIEHIVNQAKEHNLYVEI